MPDNRGPYDDIINLPHHVAQWEKKLKRSSFAAQFRPFFPKGYKEVLAEVERTTEEREDLDDYVRAELDKRLGVVFAHVRDRPEITVRYFLPDKTKPGGAYLDVTGRVVKFDPIRRAVIFENGTVVPAADIYGISGEIIDEYFPDGM